MVTWEGGGTGGGGSDGGSGRSGGRIHSSNPKQVV